MTSGKRNLDCDGVSAESGWRDDVTGELEPSETGRLVRDSG